MHRAYQPLKPSANKYLQKKWDQSTYEEHRRKVSTATPMVDTKGIQTPVHMQLKLKKRQLEGERLSIIERDNQLLSARLADIMCSKGLVNHKNNYSERSLNGPRRREELLQVTHENQAILQRLTTQESQYRRQNWEQHWERAESLRDEIARYPRGLTSQQRPKRTVTFKDGERGDTSTESGQSQASSRTSSGHENSSEPQLEPAGAQIHPKDRPLNKSVITGISEL